MTAIIVACLLHSTLGLMVSTWYGSRSYSYGFVVAPICALLIWRQRVQLSALRPVISYAGMALALVFGIIWLLGNLGDVQVVQQFAFIGLLESVAWSFLGADIVRTLAFPFLFLFFAVPAGESLIAPLQRVTAAFTVNAVRLTGVPAVQEGMLLSTPSGNWRIAEACSGIRYLTSSVVVGGLVAGVVLHRWKRRLLFILLSIAVPIIANALRAYLIVMLAYISDNRIASGIDHIVYGWVFFSLITASLVALGLAWREPEPSSQTTHREREVLPTANTSTARLVSIAASLVLGVACLSAVANLLWSSSSMDPHPHQLLPPNGWVETDVSGNAWDPEIPDGQARSFVQEPYEVSLFSARYPMTRGGIELINSLNATRSSGEWEVVNSSHHGANVAGQIATVDEYVIAAGRHLRLMWIWYLSDDRVMTSGYQVKLNQLEYRLRGRPQSVSVWAISTDMQDGRSDAASALEKFAARMSIAGLQL